MVLLLNADAYGWWPVDATAFSVILSRRRVVVGEFPRAGGACVVLAGWMETMQ